MEKLYQLNIRLLRHTHNEELRSLTSLFVRWCAYIVRCLQIQKPSCFSTLQ